MKLRTAMTMLVLLAAAPVMAQQAGTAVEVPLRVMDGKLLVPVDVGIGHPVDFIISSGSGVTVLTEMAVEHLGEDPLLMMGGLTVPVDDIATVPDEQIAIEGATVAGMIGANMLNQYDVLFDVPGGRMLLKTPGREVSWEGVALSDPMRVRVLHGIVLSFDVSLNGHEYPATMDLGTPMIVATKGVQTDLGIADKDVASLTLGGNTLADMPVNVLEMAMLRRWAPNNEGFVLVGAPIAYDCALSISWAHAEVRTCAR